MRHWEELSKIDGFYDKPFVCVGSGTTLNRIHELDLTNYNKVVLNYTNHYINNALVWFFCDHWVHFAPDFTKNHKAMVTRSINYEKATDNTFIVEYDKDMPFMNNYRVYPDKELIPMSASVSLVALLFGRLGVKRIDTVGIDGGKKRSPLLPQEGFTGEDYSQHNSGFYHWCSHYKVQTDNLIIDQNV